MNVQNLTEREKVHYDAEVLECRPWGGESSHEVKTSLRLCTVGKCGSKIVWQSDKEKVISSLGRVIRPKWNEAPVSVVMTAEISCGMAFERKEFVFTVLPDELFSDPGYESDESFFNKLDESNQELKTVLEAAGRKDYRKAKAELLHYWRGREKKKTAYEKFPSGMSRMMMSGFSTLQRCDRFYQGECAVASDSYKEYRIPLQRAKLKEGVVVTYDLCSLYNESAGVRIAGSSYFDKAMRPVLEICTKKGKKQFICLDSAVVGAGKNKENALGMQEELFAETFGAFWGDETFHSLMKFHLTGIEAEIEAAYLIIHAAVNAAWKGVKEILVMLFPENIWQGKTAKWADFKWQFANRSGLPESDTWDLEEGFDFEYLFQRVRFMHFPWLLEEYRQTEDENILYYMVKTMTDFIREKGNPRVYEKGHMHIGSAWRSEEISQTLCGGWPRGLDAAERLRSFSAVLDELADSSFMTPDAFCAVLKYVWDSCHALAFMSLTEPVTNLRQFEIIGLHQASVRLREFREQPDWQRVVRNVMENMIFSVTMEEGTYRETTGGYNFSVCENFVRYKKHCMENGENTSDAFDARLKKFAVYNALLQGPDGESLQYGDQGAERLTGILYPELTEWFQDEEMTYILSRGKTGRKPDWTSVYFPESGTAMLRSGWQKDAAYLFTQVRGGGAHGHQDDNHITLIAGGRVLLTDAGIFTYSEEDLYRKWGKSPLAHNTLCISGAEQVYGKGTGECRECFLGEQCDVLVQSSRRYEGYTYIRKIVFVKPDMFLITDEAIPENRDEAVDYKQPWHMLPTAGMSFDKEMKCIKSNFPTGSNLVIRSLDEDAELKKEMGWYDYGYQQLSENVYGYFEKKARKGGVVFHTLLQIIKGTNS